MYYFTTYARAKAWAETYGYRCPYTIKKCDNGLFTVIWNHKEPRGV